MFPREPVPADPTGRIVLRLPNESDADALAKACVDPELVRYLTLLPSPYTREDAVFWLAKAVPRTWESGGAEFVLSDAGGQVLGAMGLKSPSRFGGFEVGYWVAPWARGKGVATEALRAISRWAFEHGAPRLELIIDVANVGSQRVAMAAGYAREGVMRAAIPARDGSRVDAAQYARLPADSGEPTGPFLPFLPEEGLTDGVVRLLPLGPKDAADYHEVICLPDVVASFVPPHAPTFAETLGRCERAAYRWLAGEQADIAIRDVASGRFAGDVQLSNVHPFLLQAMVGYSLSPEFRGRGFATRAVRLLTDWAFTNTELMRLVAGTNLANVASHRVLERAGFAREGVARGLLPALDGSRTDDMQWALIKH